MVAVRTSASTSEPARRSWRSPVRWLGALMALAVLAPASAAQTALDPEVVTDELGEIPSLIDQVHPAVVQIFVSRYAPEPGNPWSLLGRESGTGAGVIVDPEGYVVTNLHVVQGARRVQVMRSVPREIGTDPRSVLEPQGELLGAQIVGTDLETDVAVLKIAGGDLPFLRFGDSEALRQGQLVFALGSPLGLGGSVSMGIVSSKARQLVADDAMIYVQSDVAVNPGNSGGPLVDLRGRVVGINSFILSQSGGSEGLSFAVPSNIVRSVYDQIRTTGRVRRGTIGVHAQTIHPLLAQGLGLVRDWGVVLGDVHPEGPAARAGLRPGDVILSLDGKAMENGRQMSVNLYAKQPGDAVVVEILRGGRTSRVEVEVVERAGDPRRFADLVDPEEDTVRRLGILGLDLDPDLATSFGGLRSRRGVVVAGILFPSSSMGDALAPGDVIRSVNGQEVDGVVALRRALMPLVPGDAVVLQIERQGRLSFLTLQLDS